MLSRLFFSKLHKLENLTEREILALAVSAAEEDRKIFLSYSEEFKENYPQESLFFLNQAELKKNQYDKLLQVFYRHFGTTVPLIRREDIRGFRSFSVHYLSYLPDTKKALRQNKEIITQSSNFYQQAALLSNDVEIVELFNQLSFEEHSQIKKTGFNFCGDCTKNSEEPIDREEKQTLLTWIQPGLAGLMDGSISTLAPIFAAAFATQNTYQTFLVGLSASIGAGISMGFTEAIHDDGKLSGRGSPVKRGLANGIMTAVGGLGHTLPYLIPHFIFATILACVIVVFELFIIAWIQKKFMKVSFSKASIQVIIGGFLVLATGILIGNF